MCKLLVSDFEFHHDIVSITIDSAKNNQYRAGSNVTLAASFHDFIYINVQYPLQELILSSSELQGSRTLCLF